MGLSRRSFLAAVLGTAAAPFLPREKTQQAIELERFDEVWNALQECCGASLYRHYTVWDSVVVRPGEVLRERLLPPPLPKDFNITSIGMHYNIEAPYKSLADVLRVTRLTLRNGALDILHAPLFVLPVSQPMQLVQMCSFKQGDDLGIYLDSVDAPVPSTDSVTISIILQGLVRVG